MAQLCSTLVQLLILCLLGKFSCLLTSADFIQNQYLRKILSEIPSEYQTVWILIRPDCLQRLSADDNRRQRVKVNFLRIKL